MLFTKQRARSIESQTVRQSRIDAKMSDSVTDLLSLASIETGLKVASLFSTGFFAGGSTFISYGFQPGVLSISNHCALVAYRAILPRCKPLPFSLLIGSLSSAAVYAISAHNNKKDISWLIGSGILALIAPQTIIFIGPINRRILKEEVGLYLSVVNDG